MLITRAAEEAEPWARQLSAAGLSVERLPLIDIGPAPDPQALRDAWTGAADCIAWMFVSANAVRRFFAQAPARVADALSWRLPTRFWATGPGTRRALIASGCDPAQIDAPGDDADQFDSEALWAKVAPSLQPGGCVLIVRGADAQGRIAGRDWLALRLEAAGLQVRQVAAYTRVRPILQPFQIQRVIDATHDGSWWWFSSSEAIANLRAAVPYCGWASARALATHPRIAEAARQAGFGEVMTCRATLSDLVASIKSAA